MTLKTLIDAVLATSRDDWNVINHTGPDSQCVRAVDRHDLAIALEWGAVVNKDFREPWTNTFSDRTTASEYIDLLYDGAIVATQRLALLCSNFRCDSQSCR